MTGSKARKSIFITGAANGIGAATARLFSQRGWFCGLTDIDLRGLEHLQAELGAENAWIDSLDVRSREDWDKALTGFSQVANGRLDVLFNNAGIACEGPVEEIDPDLMDTMIDINLKGVVNGVTRAMPLLKATHASRIVNVASVAGVAGVPRLSTYSATKFAVRGLTEALDIELEGSGIRAVALLPWFADTAILDSITTSGDNRGGKQRLEAAGVDVYPVELVAERAWEAAYGKKTLYYAGQQAARVGFLKRFFPWLVRSGLRKQSQRIG